MAKTPPLTLATPIQYAKGVGDARAAELIGLGIHTCGGLLFHLPRDYLHYTDEAPISALKAGDMATVRGILLQTRLIPKRPRRFEALHDNRMESEMDAIGRKMHEAGKPMHDLGQQMDVLGKKMDASAKVADKQTRDIIRAAQAKGLAIPAPGAI